MQTQNMTKGNVFKVLALFALPMVLSATLQQLYNLADNYIAGHCLTNIDSFNAVGIVYPVTVVFLDIAMGFGVGCGIVCARYFGAGDNANVKRVVLTGLISMTVLGILVTVGGLALMKPLLGVVIEGADGSGCFNEAYAYMMVYVAGVIFLFIYNFSMYVFQALGNSKTPLYFLIFSTVLNVGLDLFFVYVVKMQAAGLAVGTIISEAIAGVLSVVVLLKSVFRLSDEKVEKFNKARFKEITAMAVPSIAQGCFVSVGGVLVMSAITTFGGNSVAGGYSAAYKVCYIVMNIFMVLSNALSTFVSQHVGAKKYERIIPGFWVVLFACAAFAAVATLAILPFKEGWVRLFLSDTAEGDIATIIDAGKAFMSSMVPFFVLIVVKIAFDGVLKGGGDMVGFMVGTCIDLVMRVVLAFVLGYFFGYRGIFYAWPISWFVGMISSMTFFFAGRWKKKSGYTVSRQPAPSVQ